MTDEIEIINNTLERELWIKTMMSYLRNSFPTDKASKEADESVNQYRKYFDKENKNG